MEGRGRWYSSAREQRSSCRMRSFLPPRIRCSLRKVSLRLRFSVLGYRSPSSPTRAGLPADPTRATLTITSATQSCAIFGACPSCSGCQLRSVQIAGQRNVLGRIPDGIALIEMGGSNSGQVIREVKAWEPRGWSVLHAIGELRVAEVQRA